MGFDMQYTLGGRKVSQKQFFDGRQKQAVDQALTSAKASIEATRCRTHGQRARATLKSRHGDRYEFSITGCCDELVRAASRG